MRPPLRRDGLETPHPSRLAPDHPDAAEILARHRAAVATGRSTYSDPRTGLSVMTAASLAEQGWCCDSGCRHCPYAGTTDKAAWRAWGRIELGAVDLAAVSARVRAQLGPVLHDVAGRVLVYRAMADEVDVWPLVAEIGPDRCALTRTPAQGPLTVHGAEGPFERHRFGFDQPLLDAPPVEPDDLGVVLVPGLVFDRRGVRIGRGAGYYDRLLAAVGPVAAIGVTPAALVVPELPAGDHDVAMTHLVTERRLMSVEPSTSR